MQQMPAPAPEKFREGEIQDVVVRDLRMFSDDRGWLTELFRQDELPDESRPVMAYVSATAPGITRGPHEHLNQADLFCFLGPSNFKLRIWDKRRESPTFGIVMTLVVGEDNPKSVIVPRGLVHSYENIGNVVGIVINCPNRLYMGHKRRETADEIRHEDNPHNVFRAND